LAEVYGWFTEGFETKDWQEAKALLEVQLEGIRSRVTIPGTLDVALGPRTNPVTGEEEPATLLKPKGFPSPVQELGATAGLGFSSAGLAYDHSGKSGECSSFEYKGS
jgi:hypothetical protein